MAKWLLLERTIILLSCLWQGSSYVWFTTVKEIGPLILPPPGKMSIPVTVLSSGKFIPSPRSSHSFHKTQIHSEICPVPMTSDYLWTFQPLSFILQTTNKNKICIWCVENNGHSQSPHRGTAGERKAIDFLGLSTQLGFVVLVIM